MTKITLDAETFKVLASDTRLSILKSLDERPKTVSELSRELTLNKATVHEHLQQLLTGQLIKKNEREGRKWVYYALSWKGKSLLHPENTTVLVLLGLAMAGSAGAVVQLANWLQLWGMDRLFGDSESTDKAGTEDDMRAFGDPEPASGPPEDSADPDGAEMERMQGPDETNETLFAGEGADGGFFDFLSDSGFWLFAVLLLLATAAFIGALLVKQRATGRTLEGSRDIPEAEIGAVKSGPTKK